MYVRTYTKCFGITVISYTNVHTNLFVSTNLPKYIKAIAVKCTSCTNIYAKIHQSKYGIPHDVSIDGLVRLWGLI